MSDAPHSPDSAEVRLIGRVRGSLHTCVLGDVLDSLGLHHQFLPPSVRPVQADMRLVGRAMPVLVGDVFGPQTQPFGRLTQALDALGPGEVYLATRGRAECAAWGEIMTAAARTRGAAGAVLAGWHRDSDKVLAQDWPVFSSGPYAQDSGVRSAVQDFGVPVEIAGVRVEPGDLVVGDRDGVVVVPRAVEAEVIDMAEDKVNRENEVLVAIEAGMGATEAFATYGVL